MKITKRELRRIIREAIGTISREGPSTELRERFDAFLSEYDSMSKQCRQMFAKVKDLLLR